MPLLRIELTFTDRLPGYYQDADKACHTSILKEEKGGVIPADRRQDRAAAWPIGSC